MDTLTLQLITGAIVGLGAGYLGSFMVLRRMSLVGDALSHVALPGIALALVFHFEPFLGALAVLVLAVFGIWSLEKKTTLPSETLVGIFFTLSLAIGLLITPEHELYEALLGNITKIGANDLILSVILVAIMLFAIRKSTRGLVLGIISKDLTKTMGIKIDRINLVFLLMIAVIVTLGLKVAGTLLMGSLVIIPAAAAKNISTSLSHYTFWAGGIGALSAIAGIFLATYFGFIPGPIVVLTSGVVFLATLMFKK